MKRSRLHVYAAFVALCTLLVIVSGAAVTSSHDQPRQTFFQNIHTAAGVADTLLIAGLSISLFRSGTRGWVRSGTFAVVLVEAGFGELLRRGSSGPAAGTVHACLAALLFAGVAAITLFTSRSWQRAPELVQDYGWPSLRFLSGATVLLIAVQVGFGAGLRHSAVGVMPHLLGAMVVVLLIIIVGVFVTSQFPKHASLRPMAVSFMAITGIQVFLGMAAFLMRLMSMAGTLAFLAISVAHVTTGSLTLALGTMLAIEVRRDVVPRVSPRAS